MFTETDEIIAELVSNGYDGLEEVLKKFGDIFFRSVIDFMEPLTEIRKLLKLWSIHGISLRSMNIKIRIFIFIWI